MSKKIFVLLMICLLVATVFSGSVLVAGERPAPPRIATDVSGNVGGQIWTTSGSPYVVIGDIWIEQGQVLIIMPGVKVEFEEGQDYNLRVRGTLLALGTSTQHINFTSTRSGGANPADWENIVFTATSQNSFLSYVDIEGCGRGSDRIAIDVQNSNITMDHVLIRSFAANTLDGAMRLIESYSNISNLLINNNNNYQDARGIIINGGAPVLQNIDVRLRNSNQIGLHATNSDFTADGVRISYTTGVGTGLSLSNSDAVISNLYITRNAGTSGTGIALQTSSDAVISNVVIQNGMTGISSSDSDPTIQNVTIALAGGSGSTGISMTDATNNATLDEIAISSINIGITLTGSSPSISDTTISIISGGTGITATQNSNAIILRTTISGGDGIGMNVVGSAPWLESVLISLPGSGIVRGIIATGAGTLFPSFNPMRILNTTISLTGGNVYGVVAQTVSFLWLENSTLNLQSIGTKYDFSLNTYSVLFLRNTSFTKTSVEYLDTNSNLTVSWYLNVHVNRTLRYPNWENVSLPNARVWTNHTGPGINTLIFQLLSYLFPNQHVTNAAGWANWTTVFEYTAQRRNTGEIRTYYSPQNVTATKVGYTRTWDNTVNVTGAPNGQIQQLWLPPVEDTQPPTSTLTLPSPYWRNSSPVNVQFSATDSLTGNSGVYSVRLYYRHSSDNSSWGSWSYSDTEYNSYPYPDPFTGSFSFTEMTTAGEGYYELYSSATDRFGNSELGPIGNVAKARFAYDTTPPSSSAQPVPYWHNTAPITIPVSGSDNFYVEKVEFWIRYRADNRTAWSRWYRVQDYPVSPPSQSFSMNVLWTPPREGHYRYQTIAVDTAGNSEALSTAEGEFCYRVPAQLQLSGPGTMNAGEQVMFGVKVTNRTGVAVNLSAPLNVALETSSPNGFFRAHGTTNNITSVQIPQYSSDTVFDYNDTKAGVWLINATSGPLRSQVQITVGAANIDRIVIEPASWTMSADETKMFSAIAYDRYGNTVSATFNWAATNGSVINGLFTPWSAGRWTIYANASGKSGSATVSVLPGKLEKISVTPPILTIGAGETEQFSAVACDKKNNPLSVLAFNWSVTNNIGTIVNGLFTAGKLPARGQVIATLTLSGITRSGSADVTVVPGKVARIQVIPHQCYMQVSATKQFSAKAYDRFDNQVVGAVFTWSATAGTINSAGYFTAPSTPMTVYVNATNGTVTGSAKVVVTTQAWGMISGYVFGNLTPPVAIATRLSAYYTDGTLAAQTVSNNITGYYELHNLLSGSYVVCAAPVSGYRPCANKTVEVRAFNETANVNFTFEPLPGAIVSGVVLNGTSKMGIENAYVAAYDAKTDTLKAYALTDSAGNYRLPQLYPAGEYYLYANRTGYNRSGRVNLTLDYGENRTVNFYLYPLTGAGSNGSFSGGVYALPARKPLFGARVEVYSSADVLVLTLHTDRNGNYWAHGLAPGHYRAVAGYPYYRTETRFVTVSAAFDVPNIDFILSPLPGWIEGFVYEAGTGKALQDATVTVTGVNSTVTDTAGHYNISVSPGTYTVTAGKPGYRTDTKTVTVYPSKTTTQNFYLVPYVLLGSISGTVKDERGNAIDNATVTLKNERGTVVNTTLTNRTGWFSISGLVPGNYTLRVSKEGYEDYTIQIELTTQQIHRQLSITLRQKLEGTPLWILLAVLAAVSLIILFVLFWRRKKKPEKKKVFEEPETVVTPSAPSPQPPPPPPPMPPLAHVHREFVAHTPLRAAVVNKGTAVKLDWDSICSDMLYRIYYSKDGKNFEKIAELQKGITSYKHEGLHWGQTHYYKLGVVNVHGHESIQPEALKIVTQPPEEGIPPKAEEPPPLPPPPLAPKVVEPAEPVTEKPKPVSELGEFVPTVPKAKKKRIPRKRKTEPEPSVPEQKTVEE